MIKRLFFVCFLLPIVANAEVLPLDVALRATYTACVGIDDELADLKKMAGINTAVTGVGTGLGAGATVVGIVKAKKDRDAKEVYDEINYMTQAVNVVATAGDMDSFDQDFLKVAISKDKNYYDKLRQQSKKLGNWRTGLMVGNTATNVAGAIIAGNNKVDDDLQTQIDNCKAAVKNLRDSINQARFNGEDISEANEIANICGEYNYVDVSKINNRGRGAMISSIVGATTGVAGTVTSAVANSENVRKDNLKIGEKTESDWKKEENINTAANVLAGASTVASATATVFNATQISAIKKLSDVAKQCTGVLK